LGKLVARVCSRGVFLARNKMIKTSCGDSSPVSKWND
jgi:hypothetical protein